MTKTTDIAVLVLTSHGNDSVLLEKHEDGWGFFSTEVHEKESPKEALERYMRQNHQYETEAQSLLQQSYGTPGEQQGMLYLYGERAHPDRRVYVRDIKKHPFRWQHESKLEKYLSAENLRFARKALSTMGQ